MTYSAINWNNIRTTVQANFVDANRALAEVVGKWARASAARMHLVPTQVLQQIATTLESFNAVLGLEALNEPWQYTPLDVLKAFYWDAYWAVRAAAPHWLFVIQVFPCRTVFRPQESRPTLTLAHSTGFISFGGVVGVHEGVPWRCDRHACLPGVVRHPVAAEFP